MPTGPTATRSVLLPLAFPASALQLFKMPVRHRTSDSLQRVEETIRAAKIDDSVCHERRRKDRADGKLSIGRYDWCFSPVIKEEERHVESSLRGQDPVCVLLGRLGLKFPKQPAGVAIARFQGAVQDADKNDIVRDRGRGEHEGFVLLFQNRLAGPRFHNVIETGIGSSKIDLPIHYRGGSNDPA